MAGVTDPYERRRLSEEDRCTRRRYDEFRSAAEYVSAAFAAVPAVMRVARFGSVASSPRLEAKGRWRGRIHEPKDVDLAGWLDALPDLDQLRVLCGRAVHQLWQEKEIGVAHHQVDVFLLDAPSKYLGRLCHFNQCPKHKLQCARLKTAAKCRSCSSMMGWRLIVPPYSIRTAARPFTSDRSARQNGLAFGVGV